MGMCKGCSEVFNTNDMFDGYCKDCYDNIKDIHEKCTKCNQEFKVKLENGICQKCTQSIKNKESQNIQMIISIIGAVIILVIGYLVYDMKSRPSQEMVKKIASQYDYKFRNINIVDYYKKDGKIIYILEINNMICEMPMIEVRNEWIATGINCKGSN